jgi:hypothetical protein
MDLINNDKNKNESGIKRTCNSDEDTQDSDRDNSDEDNSDKVEEEDNDAIERG